MEYAELRVDDTYGVWLLRLRAATETRSSGRFRSDGLEQSRTRAEILLAEWGYTLGAVAWVNIDGLWLIPVVPLEYDRSPS